MFTNDFINNYAKYANDENFNTQKIETELSNNQEDGLFFIHNESIPDYPGSTILIGIKVLSFFDDKNQVRRFKVDENRITEMMQTEESEQLKKRENETYDNINDILNRYNLNHVFRQKEYIIKQKQNFIKKVNDNVDYFLNNQFAITSNNKISTLNIDPKTLEGQTAFLQITAQIIKKSQSPIFLPVTFPNFLRFFQLDKNSKEGKELIIKIVKLMAREGCNVSQYIRNFGIDQTTPNGQKALIEIVKLAAVNGKDNGRNISLHIRKYGINTTFPEGQKALIEIAKSVNLQDCNNLLFLRNFDLPTEIARQIIILALSSAKDEDVQVLVDQLKDNQYINSRSYIDSLMEHTFHIKNLLLREKFTSKEDATDVLDNTEITPREALLELSAYSEFMNSSLQPFLSYADQAYQALENKAQKGKITLQTKKQLQENLVRFTGLTFLRISVLEEQGQKINTVQVELLKRIIDLQDPVLRQKMLFHIINNPSHESIYQKILTSHPDTQLTMFLLISLHPNLSEQQLDAQFRVLNQRPDKKKPLLTDAYFQKTVLRGLLSVLEDQTLSNDQKIIFTLLLTLKTNKNSLKNAFQSIKGLIDMHEQERIGTWLSSEAVLAPQENFFDFLNVQYLTGFQQLIPLSDQYCQMNTIENFLKGLRDPSLIFRYATNLKRFAELHPDLLDATPLFELLAKAIEAQIAGASSQDRSQYRYEYTDEDGSHLNHIFMNNKELKEKWIEPLREDLSTILSSTPQSDPLEDTLEVIEGDNFFDLMAIGTEVPGSCQNVDENPELNKCLLAYVVDGKNRLVAIRDKATGIIKARAILRILIDKTTQQPVLFMEEFYPSSAKPAWKEGLIAMAKRKAQELNKARHPPLIPIPLLHQATNEQEQGKRYSHSIESLNSPAPFEYVDAKKGIQPNGKFTIEDTSERGYLEML